MNKVFLQIVHSYAYMPYGEMLRESVTGYGYSGEWYDAATGMQNLRARQYEPAMTRFSQPDVIRGSANCPTSQNRYAYVWNDPVNLVDRNGLLPTAIADSNASGADIVAYYENIDGKLKKTEAEKAKTAYEVAQAAVDGMNGDLTRQLRQTNALVEQAIGKANARIAAREQELGIKPGTLSQEEKDKIFAEECWNVTDGYKDYWNRQDGYFDQASGWEATGVKAHEATVVFSAMERGGLSEEKTSDFGISDLYQAFMIGSMEQGATLVQTLAALAYLHEYGNITYDDFVAIGIYTGLESQRTNESEEWAVLMELSYRTSQFGLTLAAANSLYLREQNMQLIAYLALQAGLLAEQLLLGPSGVIYKKGGLDAIEFEGVDNRWQQGDSGGSASFDDNPKFAFEEDVAAGGVGREVLDAKAPDIVAPGVKTLTGQHIDDRGRVQPWTAHYDEYGRIIARTDYNAGNATEGIPDTHYHLFEWGPGKIKHEYASHIEGVYVP